MRVEKLFKRLKREFLKVNLLQAALDAILFFLSFNLVLFLFSLRFSSAGRNLEYLVPLTLILFGFDFLYRSRNYNIEIYEEKNPELRERLRTARDNLEQNNIVSQALFDEVLDRSRSVTSESIIPSKRIIQKMLAIGFLSFLTVLSGLTNFQVLQQGGELLPEPDEILGENKKQKEDFKLRNGSGVYGEKDEISVSDSLITYNITGTGEAEQGSADERLRGDGDVSLRETFSGMSDNLQLAKRYNLEIREFR